jgi:FKBP-type peptidyl-prolyl cis-trans isomerase SlyD
MQIQDQKVVTLDYTLKDQNGNVLDSTDGRGDFAYLHGAKNIIPGLESALEGKTSGDEVSVVLQPEEAYGQRDDALTKVVSRDVFDTDEDLKVGMQFRTQLSDGSNIVVTVIDIDNDKITIDGNHPLAGAVLDFDVKVINVRDATDEEVSHGHVHN